MTTIRVIRKAGLVNRIDLEGHSGYADSGEDIVCAAITSAVRYAEVMLNEVLNLNVPFRVDEDTTSISFTNINSFSPDVENIAADAVFEGFLRYMKQLSAEYPDYLNVLEVQQDA